MYRYHHDLLPPGLPNNKFTVQSDIHNYNTRQALNLHIDPTNTKLAKNTIKTQGPMIWYSINKTIKNCCSLVSFKNSLKKYILAQYESNVTTNKYATLTESFALIYVLPCTLILLYNIQLSLYCSFMNHFVHMGIFSLYILKMSFYGIMLSVKASSHDTTIL